MTAIPPPARAYRPDLLVAAGAVLSGAALTVAGGAVLAVGDPAPGAELVPLPGSAIVPGLGSAHGHAFQRALRGRAQRAAPGRSTFWTWREAMYAAALRLSPDGLEAIARLAFMEAARAGTTAWGEFHYLHRDPAGAPYRDPDELAHRVVRAARQVGLRLTLLRGAYARAGFGRPPDPAQRRFVEASPDDAVAALDRLAAAYAADPLVRFGLAPHSVRACPADWIGALAAEASRRGSPLHLHVAEQPREVEECRAEHGRSPVQLLDALGALGPGTTAVHAIHLDAGDAERLGLARATVCACPLTERDLADGVVPADRLLAAGVSLALGCDGCVEVDPLAEARALEGHLRLVRGERCVLASPGGPAAPGDLGSAPAPARAPAGMLAGRLLDIATAGAMASIGHAGGRLAPGDPADFAVLDLDDPSLAGAPGDDLLERAVFSMARTAIRDVYVAGEPVVRSGRAVRVDERRAVAEAVAALDRLARGP